MNERIRELAEQAGIDFFKSTDPEFNGKEFCEAWTEQQQKFAELIIRECAQFVEDNFDFVGDEIIVKEKMLGHFGVEQDSEEDSDKTCPRCGAPDGGTSCGLPECGWVVGVEE